MRSWLFAPGDDPNKLAKAYGCGADIVIVDLEDSVATAAKAGARRSALAFLQESGRDRPGPQRFVRINAFQTGLADADLDTIMTGAPDGILLPKSAGGADISALDAKIAVREALHDLADGSTQIAAIATAHQIDILKLLLSVAIVARPDGHRTAMFITIEMVCFGVACPLFDKLSHAAKRIFRAVGMVAAFLGSIGQP